MYFGGYYFDSKTIITVNIEHSYQLSIANVEPGTFETPCDPYSLQLKDPAKSYANAYQFALAADTATYVSELAASSTPSSSTAQTPGVQCKILEQSMARYYVSPEKWVERDAQNFDALNNTIINKSRRQDYRRSAHGSCLNMLVILAAENLKRQDDIGTWASAECRKILDAGLLAPDTVGFDNFRNAYESVNRSKTKPDDEQALCLLYISAVKDLGEQISNRVELKFDADTTADKSMNKTIELLSQIFVKVETKAADTGRAGGRPRHAAPDRVHHSNDGDLRPRRCPLVPLESVPAQIAPR